MMSIQLRKHGPVEHDNLIAADALAAHGSPAEQGMDAHGRALSRPARLHALWDTGLLDSPTEEGFDRLTRLVKRHFGAAVCLVSLVDEARQFFKSQVGLPEPWASRRETALSHSFCQYVVSSNAPLRVDNARAHPLVCDNLAIRDLGVEAYLGVPLRLPNGEVIGSLCVIAAQPRLWTAEEVAELEAYAALTMDQVLLRRKVRELARATGALQERNRLLGMAEQLARLGHWRLTVGANELTCSEQVFQIFGRDPVMGMPSVEDALERYHAEDRPAVVQAMQDALVHGRDINIEARVITRDGETRRVLSRGTCERDSSGRVIALFGILIDVTEQRRAERKLREQNERFDLALANMDKGLCFFDGQRRLIVANRKYGEIYNLQPEELRPGTALATILAARERQGTVPAQTAGVYTDWLVNLAGQGDAHESFVPLANGRIIHLHVQPMPDGGWVATHKDITERLEAEEALRQREASYRLLAENSSDVIILGHPDGRRSYFSPAVTQMLGYTVEEALAVPMRDWVHPEEMAEVFTVTKGLTAENPTASVVYRLRRKDGTYIWAEAAFRRAADEKGEVTIVTAVRDVTRRQAAQAEYRALFENAVVGIFRMSLAGEMLRANPACVTLRGFASEQDLLTSSAGGITAWLAVPEQAAGFLAAIHASERVDEFIAAVRRHGSGETMLVSLTAWLVRDTQGAPAFIEGTVADVTERMLNQSRMTHLARHDALTGLPNRQAFREHLLEAMAEATAQQQALHLLYLDLDRFKVVNDTYGHSAGDEFLGMAAARLVTTLGSAGLLARLGGDEFAVLTRPGLTQEDAEVLARGLIAALSDDLVLPSGIRVDVGLSIGLASSEPGVADAERLLRQADLAMYCAKREGRNNCRIFTPAMDADNRRRREMEAGLQQALVRDQFELHFQPVLSLASNTVVGFEALLRWRREDGVLVPPGEFIPVAEDARLIVPIGEWVIRKACAAARHWPRDTRVAVNVSAIQLRQISFLATIVGALADNGLPPGRLEIEVTESVLLDDSSTTLEVLRQLKALGVRIALDDFGTGYSSLGYLRQHHFDRIKIDRSFTQAMDERDTGAIVRAIIQLGTRLGLCVTAEGVETAHQLASLEAYGCHEVQGYLVSRPLTEQAAREFLSRLAEAA